MEYAVGIDENFLGVLLLKDEYKIKLKSVVTSGYYVYFIFVHTLVTSHAH